MNNRILSYIRLTRINQPIGTLLLLWPTCFALWLASNGLPQIKHIVIFVCGTFLMRSAGCAINDYFDRDIDAKVKRTLKRPLATGEILPWEALLVAAFLALVSFALVLCLNRLCIVLSVVALAIAVTYPLFKRFFALPQAYLGIAFGFGIPMAFAAVQNKIPLVAWVLLVANIFWALAYDSAYAMADKEDDVALGLHSSVITWGRYDVAAIVTCYVVMFVLIGICGYMARLGIYFIAGYLLACGCAIYHYFLIRARTPKQCLKAFHHNNYLGASLFIGIVFELILR